MINPLRSEQEAFRFVIGALAYFGAIAGAAVIDKWAGLVVFIVLTAAIVVLWVRAKRDDKPVRTAPRPSGANEHRILVIANETVGGQMLRQLILSKAEAVDEQVLVVVPALNSPLRHWASDEDNARAAAADRLEQTLQRLKDAGVEAAGTVGDGDPLQAMEDALRTFGADEIVISTHPAGKSNWLERGVVDKARERFAVPITHVVTDLSAEEQVPDPKAVG
jgi:hypothetical protein